MALIDSVKKVKALAAQPLSSIREKHRVDIIMLKFKEEPVIIDKAINRIIHNTDWPFKLTVFDNRPFRDEENNRNTSKIWNKLIRESTCKYVLVIDSDAFIPGNKLSPCWLTRMMESINQTGFVIPVSSHGGGQHQRVNGAENYPSSDLNKDCWSGYCFLMDRDAYESVGEFDERFYIYGQDSEFAHRVGKHGGAVMRRDVYVEHIGGYSFADDPDRSDDKVHAWKLFQYLTQRKTL
jgi:predicted glycosyltransferase involved in capsule biosynthesis